MGGKMNLKPLQSMLIRWSRQLTWPWIGSFALLAACAGFYLAVVMPMRHALTDLKAHLRTMQHDEQRLVQASQASARLAPAGQLDMFYQAFPSEDSVPDTIERLIDVAKKQGLEPSQAQYRVMRNNPGELLSYQITLPIKGAYPKIMVFAFDLLSSTPNLSLDNVGFERQKIGDNVVEATLLMTLYIKRGRSFEH